MSYKTILIETIDNIKILTLNNPQKQNALSQLFFDEFNECIDNFRHNSDIRSLIIKGDEKVFSAGGDLKEMLNADEKYAYLMCVRAQKSFEALMSLDFPVIALLDGIVYGGGFELALHCDVKFCTKNAILKLPETDIGLIPASGGISLFSKTFSVYDIAYYLFSGNQIPVEEACKKGIIQKIVEPNELFDTALTFAKEISKKPSETISTIKRILYANLFSDLENCLKMEAIEFASALQRNGKDKIRDFFEKRNK
jgi:enoyl-CoA hydratase/carnithine racemase